MTLGRREYTEADMLRMQREAEERVREMQSRARETVEGGSPTPPPQNRNWSSGQGSRRRHRRFSPEPPRPRPEPEPEPEPGEEQSEPEAAAQPEPVEKKNTTIVEDVMGALNLDEDYMLIIGLLLILINQRADTTLILALAYLLI